MSGVKRLTPDNWTEPDAVNANFVRFSPLVGAVTINGEDWTRRILAIELADHVPSEIAELFAVARGAMLYGWFYYPLFRLGEEQFYRVLEAAARLRYRQLDGPRPRPKFAQAITYLRDAEAISESEYQRWDAAREMRNIASHPDRAAVMPPGAVLGALELSARDIGCLFS